MLSIRRYQFVSFVDSCNKKHDENVAHNGSQNYPAKNTKIYLTHKFEKYNREELQWQKTLEICENLWKVFKRIHYTSKNCEKDAIG